MLFVVNQVTKGRSLTCLSGINADIKQNILFYSCRKCDALYMVVSLVHIEFIQDFTHWTCHNCSIYVNIDTIAFYDLLRTEVRYYKYTMSYTNGWVVVTYHYVDVIMSTIASQITSLTIVYSTIYSGADQSKDQSSASLAFVWGIHRGPLNSPHKWPVTRNMFPFDDVIMSFQFTYNSSL